MSPLRPAGERLGSCAVKQQASALQAALTFTECPWTEDVCEREKVWGMHAHGLMSACVNARVCVCVCVCVSVHM